MSQVDVLKAIKAHSESVRNAQGQEVEVPEWGITLHIWPLTLGEQQEIVAAARENADDPYKEIMATILIRSKNADRSRIFVSAIQAKPVLEGAPAKMILRVVKAIQATDLDIDGVKKSSKITTTPELSMQ